MKFKNDQYGDRVLETVDSDGDRLRVIISDGLGFSANVIVNHEAVIIGRKKLRRFARAILKETSK